MERPHHKYQNVYTSCPICYKKYDTYWKIVNHIRKSKNDKHKDLLEKHESEYIDIYLSSRKDNLHDNLAKAKNIFAGTSFQHSCMILRKRFSSEDLETIRRNRISKTMSNVPKTKQHNRNVSNAVKQAWIDGKFDTPEVREARRKGYAKRDFKGKNNPMYGKPSPRGAGRGKGGIRKDIGHYVRSTWEANVCRVYQLMGRRYEYEKKRFFITINGTDFSYCPDLYIPAKGFYIEIKGHARSAQKWVCECKHCKKNRIVMAAVKSEYKIRLLLMGRLEYTRFKRLFSSAIPLWEK